MTQQEFEARTGLTVSKDEYSFIEEMYYDCGDMDKDTFCADYAKHHESLILRKTAENEQLFRRVSKINDNKNAGCAERLLDIAASIKEDNVGAAVDLVKMAEGLAERRKVIAMKVEKHPNLLTKDDLEYIKKNLC